MPDIPPVHIINTWSWDSSSKLQTQPGARGMAGCGGDVQRHVHGGPGERSAGADCPVDGGRARAGQIDSFCFQITGKKVSDFVCFLGGM